ncbi:2-oxo-4-hydroxy-4-carboxy-5-ureidoimidazoline decarboxylase [Rhodococcus sovatensis]|uniref:2-oxo-4-hydroxy-4-carboxy-5-ureidoimidazoline decarboxylase n=1 Tax=Rhodococcus sovatensis TaxID=1805840 RepID=A0ABZ2PSV3_9NOCA
MLHEWIGLDGFNRLSDRQAMHALFECCSSSIWARRVACSRPYSTRDQLLDRADRVLAELSEAEVDNALDGHPRIGDKADNASSKREQAAVQSAGADVLTALAEANRKYEAQFGHVYLVCATGRSAPELLAILDERLGNDPETERRVLRVELAKINRIRLNRMLGPEE